APSRSDAGALALESHGGPWTTFLPVSLAAHVSFPHCCAARGGAGWERALGSEDDEWRGRILARRPDCGPRGAPLPSADDRFHLTACRYRILDFADDGYNQAGARRGRMDHRGGTGR